jgi:hypothetical protein
MDESTRTCTGCGVTQPSTEFPVRGKRCLPCRRAVIRAHYQANKPYYLAKARARQQRVVQENREWLIIYLRKHPCSDCGNRDIRVLEFDHRDPRLKQADVAVLARAGYPLRKVIAEVQRCDVRCANCHRIRTHQQRGWWGADLDGGTTPLDTGAPGGIRTPKPSDP